MDSVAVYPVRYFLWKQSCRIPDTVYSKYHCKLKQGCHLYKSSKCICSIVILHKYLLHIFTTLPNKIKVKRTNFYIFRGGRELQFFQNPK